MNFFVRRHIVVTGHDMDMKSLFVPSWQRFITSYTEIHSYFVVSHCGIKVHMILRNFGVSLSLSLKGGPKFARGFHILRLSFFVLI
jgi:hypothetical protein